jgi:hypothetical protein
MLHNMQQESGCMLNLLRVLITPSSSYSSGSYTPAFYIICHDPDGLFYTGGFITPLAEAFAQAQAQGRGQAISQALTQAQASNAVQCLPSRSG